MLKKNVIAIIPARNNSKRIPGKNYKKFNGKPIIVKTIKAKMILEKTMRVMKNKKVLLQKKSHPFKVMRNRSKHVVKVKLPVLVVFLLLNHR